MPLERPVAFFLFIGSIQITKCQKKKHLKRFLLNGWTRGKREIDKRWKGLLRRI